MGQLEVGWWRITFATTSNPLVPLSNLCTIPGRILVSHVPQFWPAAKLLNSSSKISSSSESLFGNATVGRLQWWRIPFTSVPLALPGAGWTTWMTKKNAIHNFRISNKVDSDYSFSSFNSLMFHLITKKMKEKKSNLGISQLKLQLGLGIVLSFQISFCFVFLLRNQKGQTFCSE